MIPIYSIVSFLGLLLNDQATHLELLRNCYEACVVASFFTLLCHYIAPNLHEQKEYFRGIEPKPWLFPLNKVKPPRSGLTWFNIIYVGIFQFTVTRPFLTLIAVITKTQKRYCPSSDSYQDAHLWIAIFQGCFVLIAMYCLAQFYKQIKVDLTCHSPFLKFLCIKLALFLCFWQTWLLGLLSRKNAPLRPTRSLVALDIIIGIPCMLVCFEMTIFACISHFAFPWKPYEADGQLRGAASYACTPCKAMTDALNPWDYAKAAARGIRWLFRGVHQRKSDPSYQRGSNTEQRASERIDTRSYIVAASRGRATARSDPSATGSLTKRIERSMSSGPYRHTVG